MALFVHLGLGCAAKSARVKLNLFVCVVAAFLPDILYFLMMLAGLKNPVNWTHSLVMCLAMALTFFLVTILMARNLQAALVYALLVLSHWVVDFITWPLAVFLKDASHIPIFMETDSVLGIGLYENAFAAYTIEIVALVSSVALLVWFLRKRRKSG